jgi:hypothetical protein
MQKNSKEYKLYKRWDGDATLTKTKKPRVGQHIRGWYGEGYAHASVGCYYNGKGFVENPSVKGNEYTIERWIPFETNPFNPMLD